MECPISEGPITVEQILSLYSKSRKLKNKNKILFSWITSLIPAAKCFPPSTLISRVESLISWKKAQQKTGKNKEKIAALLSQVYDPFVNHVNICDEHFQTASQSQSAIPSVNHNHDNEEISQKGEHADRKRKTFEHDISELVNKKLLIENQQLNEEKMELEKVKTVNESLKEKIKIYAPKRVNQDRKRKQQIILKKNNKILDQKVPIDKARKEILILKRRFLRKIKKHLNSKSKQENSKIRLSRSKKRKKSCRVQKFETRNLF